ncbi:MAG: hypothetical protein NHB32_03450 [Fischerella sp. CENA71]|nr:hypothetical protein [Fischerella sp. CENA71]
MNTVEFLTYLRSLDIQVFIDGEKFRANAPDRMLTPELRAEIQERKAEIIKFLEASNRTNNQNFKPLLPISHSGNLPLGISK